MDDIQNNFVKLLKENNIALSIEQLNQFELYYKTLVEWNEKMNLTAITEREQVYMKHFYDSLSLSFYFPMGQVSSLADIGSGAGFPSIPLKIAFPHLRITIVDSLNKRILFLRELVSSLGLKDTECVHGRAEDISRLSTYRDSFDLVTARAVARLSVLNEFCLPFAKKGGAFIAMKGSEIDEELVESSYSLSELRGKLIKVNRMQLPIEDSIRHFVQIEKVAPTPAKYPRKAGLPLKSPLVKI
ncbi:16S rRNA (guanine(527)-N(7))-methyltransferase RsmG [Paenibacillus sp. SYP-B3998]|uniref:Ribosomal RNA small subunit methyltransferase G n=1 Tax=Paenibacillus sp. SYP-B3998 TaxID=2678564 RepID=A0A6G3ZYQ9_9BACL|nr:16S rRNA (guanine(527)-N(7))-methyltransferase RsmG [Paenibacillus sp. SYP-B3998]NEW07272.1 16S rRNA (guanine(527)-N(7))-methyltransferase RsmG [Paenibacillus sp. SYP-B3998]